MIGVNITKPTRGSCTTRNDHTSAISQPVIVKLAGGGAACVMIDEISHRTSQWDKLKHALLPPLITKLTKPDAQPATFKIAESLYVELLGWKSVPVR